MEGWMTRGAKEPKLDTRHGRSKLAPRREPYWRAVSKGLTLGYRRSEAGAGSWIAKHYSQERGRKLQALGLADDSQDANGETILTFDQAQAALRAWFEAFSAAPTPEQVPTVVTVEDALVRYQKDLETRGGDLENVSRLRHHLREPFLARPVAELKSAELRDWRDGLATKLAAATVNRTTNAFKAALNLTADHFEEILNRGAWDKGLAALRDAEAPRNVILSDAEVRAVIAAAYDQGTAFGLLIEVAAVTGARYSQIARLLIQDLLADPTAPRLMMPSSLKGKGQKRITRRPVPITLGLARQLAQVAVGRNLDAPLLVKSSGETWNQSDHSRPFRRAAALAKLAEKDGEPVTLYALRHSSITRQLLAGVPIRVVAAQHDTSVVMIERNYSSLISDHADALSRAALLDGSPLTPVEAANEKIEG